LAVVLLALLVSDSVGAAVVGVASLLASVCVVVVVVVVVVVDSVDEEGEAAEALADSEDVSVPLRVS
jgi:hypothetical protein